MFGRIVRRVVAQWILKGSAIEEVRGGERKEYLDQVWGMYETSYRAIGMHIKSPSELLEYDVWSLLRSSPEEPPAAFVTYKTTHYGLKLGLAGSDGSASGKSMVKLYLRHVTHKAHYYGEVSHAVERLTEGSPVICAVDAKEVLKKPITVSPDGVHYKRNLEGVGTVEKKMIGRPKGIVPDQSCPIPDENGQIPVVPHAKNAKEARIELAEHASCMLGFDEDED